jgi:ectoine hydroxylase-related dioxygenase (phytanoyl-CoA dioxygenase family)
MSANSNNNLTDLLALFDEQGYVILRDFLEHEVTQKVEAEVIAVTDEHINALFKAGNIKDKFESEPWATRLARVYTDCSVDPPTTFRKELHKKGFYPLFCHPQLLDIVEQILRCDLRLYPNYSIRPKLPDHEAMLVFWHQDAAYTEEMKSAGDVTQARMVNVWTPLVPATTENGCMQFIPKTHKLGLVPHSWKNKFYLEINEEYLSPRIDHSVDIELNPGDIVLFSNLLFHQGLPNRSQGIRWSVDWRYQDAAQPTLREEAGHLVRSRTEPGATVQNADHWAELSFS